MLVRDGYVHERSPDCTDRCRPVAVLDPDDRGQHERLWALHDEALGAYDLGVSDRRYRAFGDALRAYAETGGA